MLRRAVVVDGEAEVEVGLKMDVEEAGLRTVVDVELSADVVKLLAVHQHQQLRRLARLKGDE
jgi:hypothetical protein